MREHDQQVFLFATHEYSEDFIREFNKIRKATKELGPCLVLYHAKDNEKVHPKILALPHFICTETDILNIGYPTYSLKKDLIPGSCHYPLIKFYREHAYKFYWFIEYDVRYTGRWKNFFEYFSRGQEDLLTCHVRSHAEQVKWVFWSSLSHPTQKLEFAQLTRSFNPIYRISYPALKFIDDKYQDQWRGHCEVTFATFLYNAGFAIRDFGGEGRFVHPKDKNKFYTDKSVVFRPAHLWLFNQPKNKIVHPYKPKERRRCFKQRVKKMLLPFFLYDENRFQKFKKIITRQS